MENEQEAISKKPLDIDSPSSSSSRKDSHVFLDSGSNSLAPPYNISIQGTEILEKNLTWSLAPRAKVVHLFLCQKEKSLPI